MHARSDHNTSKLSPLHPLLRNVGVEGGAIAVRLFAYLGSLAALALLGMHLWSEAALFQPLDPPQAAKPAASPWMHAIRPQPAFSVPVPELAGKDQNYEIQRHPEGGRKDTLRFGESDGSAAVFEVEIYRPGRELAHFPSVTAVIAARAGVTAETAETAGVLETKLGTTHLVRFVRKTGAANQSCTGFVRGFETPRLQISGFSCNGEPVQQQRQSIACAIDRLTMLSSGSDTALAALFARAELKRMGCGAPPANADWITANRDPNLRGSLGAMRN